MLMPIWIKLCIVLLFVFVSKLTMQNRIGFDEGISEENAHDILKSDSDIVIDKKTDRLSRQKKIERHLRTGIGTSLGSEDNISENVQFYRQKRNSWWNIFDKR
jgi:hypothetical protein